MPTIDVSEYAATVTASWSEATFTRAVVQLFRSYGWLVHHTRPARSAKGWRTPVMGDVGFPDIVACSRKRLFLAELKVKKGSLSIAQCAWQGKLEFAAGYLWFKDRSTCVSFDYFLWRPEQWSEIKNYAQEWGDSVVAESIAPTTKQPPPKPAGTKSRRKS
jgi:hypothetical protein